MSKESNQHRPDQEPTVTSKSSGLNYESAKIESPAGESGVGSRENSTKNDKA